MKFLHHYSYHYKSAYTHKKLVMAETAVVAASLIVKGQGGKCLLGGGGGVP